MFEDIFALPRGVDHELKLITDARLATEVFEGIRPQTQVEWDIGFEGILERRLRHEEYTTACGAGVQAVVGVWE